MRLAADANVLLSAVIGGRAKLILESPQIDEILTVEPIMAEVEERVARSYPASGITPRLSSLCVNKDGAVIMLGTAE